MARHVGLSNICYTVLQIIHESCGRRFPAKRSHGETVVTPVVYVELLSKIIKGVEFLHRIEVLVILAV